MTTSVSQSFGRVAVMLGGNSAEREVSLRSGRAVHAALLRQGIDAIAFDPAEQPLYALPRLGVDRVYIMLHGRGGEDGTLQGALTSLGIPFTGSGVLGSALAMDKVRSKQIWQSCGLPTAAYVVVEQHSYHADACARWLQQLGGEVMVKPAREGSSIGMARVNTAAALHTAIVEAFRFDQQVLLEQFIVGKEFTLGLVGTQVLPSIRMSTPHEFYDYAAKYQDSSTQYFCPSGLTPAQEDSLAVLARQAFTAIAASGWGRIDVMQDHHGHFFLLEVNTVPGMTEHSLVPKAAAAMGMSFDVLVREILMTSLDA